MAASSMASKSISANFLSASLTVRRGQGGVSDALVDDRYATAPCDAVRWGSAAAVMICDGRTSRRTFLALSAAGASVGLLPKGKRAVAAGSIFLSPDVAQTLALRNVMKREDTLALLSDREFEILRLLALGHSIRDIAEKLCLTYKTIANYQSSIRQKLGADTSVQLIRIATEHGLLAANGRASG